MNLKTSARALFLATMTAALAVPAAAADNVVLQWNNALLQAIRIARPGPPVVARMLHVAHTCMYDAWAAYDERARATRTGDALRQPRARRSTAAAPSAMPPTAPRSICCRRTKPRSTR
jgi:hypothetical protein